MLFRTFSQFFLLATTALSALALPSTTDRLEQRPVAINGTGLLRRTLNSERSGASTSALSINWAGGVLSANQLVYISV